MRFGLVGAGKIGQLRARSVREHPAARLAAVFDVRAESAQRAAAGTDARICDSLDDLLAVPLDAVIISSPVHLHLEPCLKAFERGLHVLCEKPLTHTVASSRDVVDAAIAAKRVLGVGFNLRYYPAFRFVKDTIAQGRIGRLDHVRVFGGHEGLPKFDADWQYRAPESGGGAMWDVGIHMTDLTRYVLGDITEVYGLMSENVWKVSGSEDNAVAVFRNPEGIAASYQATWIEWKGYAIAVEAYGDQGMVKGAYAPMYNELITQSEPGGPQQHERRRYLDVMLREKLRTWQTTALRSFAEELADFMSLAAGGPRGRMADGHDGLRAAEVADAVRRSTMTKEAVHLAPLGRMPA